MKKILLACALMLPSFACAELVIADNPSEQESFGKIRDAEFRMHPKQAGLLYGGGLQRQKRMSSEQNKGFLDAAIPQTEEKCRAAREKFAKAENDTSIEGEELKKIVSDAVAFCVQEKKYKKMKKELSQMNKY